MKPAAGRSLDRSKGEVTFKIKKTTCKCSYEINAGNCQKSKFTCDKKCSGNAKGIKVEDGMYVFDLAVRKGKVKVGKCKKEEGSEPGTGGGNGGNGGAGSGSGNGGEGAGASRCACVSKGMGGTGPLPPTGSGSGSGSGETPVPMTGSGSGSGSGTPGVSTGYSQAWLRGDQPYGHVHEGVRLAGGDGWVGVGDLIEEEKPDKITQMMVRRVNNAGATVWTYLVGDKHTTRGEWAYSAGYSVVG